MEFPADLKYTKDHEWVRLEGAGATVGITEFAQSELGDIVFVDLPPVGRTLKQKDAVCVVESTKAASDVYTPVGGVVSEVNSALRDTPDLVNKSSYTDGWMVKLKNASAADAEKLMSAAQYKQYLGDKV